MTGISTVTVGWSPLGGGLLTGKYRRGEMGRAESFKRLVHAESDAVKSAVLDVVLAVAEEAGGSPAVVALAWVLKRGVLPILGPRTADQLKDNLAVAKFALSSEQVARLDAASAIPHGFPHDLLASDGQRARLAGGLPDRVETPTLSVA
jgi:aryl-alcohol dehydrogenase-like predicted oxidoreductase